MELKMRRIVKYVYSSDLIKEADKNPAVQGRASLTHELIRSYGLCQFLRKLEPKACSVEDLRNFHSSDYIEQLENCGNSADSDLDEAGEDNTLIAEEYGLSFDCPRWPGILNYARAIAGGTMSACEDLCKNSKTHNTQTIIINWTGGWHHAHRDKASGFCYVNDIVLGILLLRKRYKRVLYIDLDIHHGDGVQEAFEVSQNVFTLSFHKYECSFYPGTGNSSECGNFGNGKGYSANFPYKNGIKGEVFIKYFKSLFSRIYESYKPEVCVVQCGADVIVGDPLGGSNIVPSDILECVNFILDTNLPCLLLGGGGYNFENASRFWTLLTAGVCSRNISGDIPDRCLNFLNYGPDYTINIEKNITLRDENTEEYLNKCIQSIEDNLEKYKVASVYDDRPTSIV